MANATRVSKSEGVWAGSPLTVGDMHLLAMDIQSRNGEEGRDNRQRDAHTEHGRSQARRVDEVVDAIWRHTRRRFAEIPSLIHLLTVLSFSLLVAAVYHAERAASVIRLGVFLTIGEEGDTSR